MAHASSEAGIAMIEIMVSALLIGLIAGATLTGFDAADRASTDQRHHSEADAVAQQDEERMRGLQVTNLANLNQTRTVTVDGTAYTVVSSGKFVSDSTGSSSCSVSGTANADYIKTTSTVTWPSIGSRAPVVEESILTPPAGGSLVVQVLDDFAAGVPNMTAIATDSSGSSQSVATSSSGCAAFGALAAGNYHVSVSQTGYVDRDGNSSPPTNQQLTTVVAGASDTMSFEFAKAGSISATFQTSVRGALQASTADTFVAFQNKMTTPSFRVFGSPSKLTSNTYATNVSSPASVFPFSSPYTVYTGSCVSDAPPSATPYNYAVTVPPGAVAPIVVRQPAMIVEVWGGTSTSPGSLVSYVPHVALTDTACGTEHYPATQAPNSTSGALRDPGQPYGTFSVCADSNGAGGTTVRNTATVNNSDAVNGTVVNIYLGTGAAGRSAGACT